MDKIKFQKWQGLGNDFIILEDKTATKELAINMCDRKFGIGADGLMSVKKSDNADIAWEFYNSDGTKPEKCGNGIRWFAKYVFEKGLINKKTFSVETLRGIIIPEILDDGKVKVDMNKPVFNPELIPINVKDPMDFEIEGYRASSVSMGNPHCLIFTDKDGKEPALKDGSKIENSILFPEKTNVEFINVITRTKIKVNVWERGCGITLACGTGACASVVAGIKKGLLDNKVEVLLPGGTLFIEYIEGNNVYMTGGAEKVFEGVYFDK